MTFLEALPTVNATFNSISALLLLGGWRAIRARRETIHRNLMIAAFVSSSLFLVGYLIRMSLAGSKHFEGVGVWRPVYFTILISHMILAMVVVPLVLRTIWLGWKNRRPEHRKIVRFTLPIWGYVSVTGVVVYGMLYHWPA